MGKKKKETTRRGETQAERRSAAQRRVGVPVCRRGRGGRPRSSRGGHLPHSPSRVCERNGEHHLVVGIGEFALLRRMGMRAATGVPVRAELSPQFTSHTRYRCFSRPCRRDSD